MKNLKSKTEIEIQNRKQNLYVAIVCMVLLFGALCFCSIFGNQNQKPNQEFEIEYEEEIVKPKIEIEITTVPVIETPKIEIETEEAIPIGEDETKIEMETKDAIKPEVVEAPRIVETVEEKSIEVEPLVEEQPIVSNEVAEETVEEAAPISDVPITDDCYYFLSDEDRYVALCIMACECPYEPWEGQVMVAECILNFMSYYGYSMSIVKQYFDGWKPSLEYSDPDAWATLNAAIDEVFVYGNLPTEETVLWFYNPKIGASPWHESQKFVTEICCHRFFAPWEG